MPDEINKKITAYLKDINKIINIQKVFLFGSYAQGKQIKGKSDIDLALFSKDVTDKNRHDYIKKSLRASAKYKLDIQPLVFSFDDYLEHDNPFIEGEIIAKGRELPLP